MIEENKIKLSNKAKNLIEILIKNNYINEENINKFSYEEMFYKSISIDKEDFFNILEEIENINIEKYENIIKEYFKIHYNNIINSEFNLTEINLNEIIEESEIDYKKIKNLIKKGQLEELNEFPFYILKNNSILINNKKYFQETLERIEKIFKIKLNSNYNDYIFVKIIDKNFVKTKKNQFGVNFHETGCINAYYDETNNIIIPDLRTLQYNFNNNLWTKEEIKDINNFVPINKYTNINKFSILEYLSSSLSILKKKYKLNQIDKVDIKNENLINGMPNNKIFSLSFLDLISEELLFYVIKYTKNGDIYQEPYYIKEIGDFKLTYNIENKEIPINNIKEYLLLESYKEKKMYNINNVLVLENKHEEKFSSLLDINEVHYYESGHKLLILIPKNNNFKKNIIRINFILKNNDIETLKSIETKFHIIYEEPLIFKPEYYKLKKYFQFINVEDINEQNLTKLYNYYLKNIPEEIIKIMESCNQEYLINLKEKELINNMSNI